MDVWVVLLEMVKILVPALIIFAVTYTLLNNFFKNEYNKRLLELKTKNQDILTPVRLQAYERLVLLLERISPNSLVMRVNKQGMTASQFKAELIATINEEFSHNLSQQVYVSIQAWTLVRAVKEKMINIINMTYTTLDQNASGIDLAKAIFEHLIKSEEIPTQTAIDFLKKELQIVFEQ